MVGRKTHDQQQRIINKQENTKGGGEKFSAEEDLKASKGLRDAKAKGEKLTTPVNDLSDPDDRNMLRGRNHESRGNG
ncbi:hypothetical protein [Shinella sp.]|uniref:hypothetical protein n=1 Tax=Shinella sp. TaxID=1870904 RepID=UPI0029BD2C0E|nr:hypothetical protein [Shinella sp.]MDX3977434.1 hypothetical protein [Shinella sp.]